MNIVTRLIFLFMLFLTSQAGIAATTNLTGHQYDVNHDTLGEVIYSYDTSSNSQHCCLAPLVEENHGRSFVAFVSDFVVTQGGRSAGAMVRREYQGASYHGKVGNAVKSKAPTNGQDALDMSVQVKGTSPRRVGIDYKTGEFAVFDQTSSGVFHGHVRGWKDLTSQMQNSLRKSGMVDRKGNILGGGQ